MRAPIRLDRSATSDLPLRLLAGVVLAALVLATAAAASDAARATSQERAAREALQTLDAAVDGVLLRAGSRVHFSIDFASLPSSAQLVLERGAGEGPALIGSVRAQGKTLARLLLCENCEAQWGDGSGAAFVVGAGTELDITSNAAGNLRVEVLLP